MMYKHHLRAVNFVVTNRFGLRLRFDGVVAGRFKKTILEDDAKDAVRHAVASARLEGVSLPKQFIARVYREAVGVRPASGKRSRPRNRSTRT
jgi:hypothetical protein